MIGVDLAWGTRAPTGVALLRRVPSGRASAWELIRLTSVVSDADLDAVLQPDVTGPCLVAVDAPLIVTNPTGRRPCEAALSRAFAAQHAGAYPANTSLPTFADGGRAARLARRHALTVDATSPPRMGQRRAIEVYPHSATVALFDLARVLPYKAGRGRTLEVRRAALLQLLTLICTLQSASDVTLTLPAELRDTLRRLIETAPTGAALRRVEDPIDAIVCAYVGALFLAGRAFVIGDDRSGAIVTPVRRRHLELLGSPAFVDDATGDEYGVPHRSGGLMSLTDEDIVTTRTGANQPVGQAGGDADQSDSDSTQVDPAGVDPAGADHAGGDADQSDSDSTQVDPAGVDPAGGDADQSDK